MWGEGGLVKKGGKYFYIRNSSSIVVFAVGGSCVASRLGFKVIGAHTDSPALKIKPRSKRAAEAGLPRYEPATKLQRSYFDEERMVGRM